MPQASTSFSSFGRLYGHNSQGIFDLVNEQWEQGVNESQTVVQQVLEMRAFGESTGFSQTSPGKSSM